MKKGGKKCKCRISGVRKKNENERKVPEKKSKCIELREKKKWGVKIVVLEKI